MPWSNIDVADVDGTLGYNPNAELEWRFLFNGIYYISEFQVLVDSKIIITYLK